MSSLRFVAAFFSLVVLLSSAPRLSAKGFSLFSQSWGDVIVNTDTTTKGRELTPPSPDQPVYYVGSSLGCRLGSIPGDLLPDTKKMNLFIAKVLAKQGYLGAKPGVHEPTLYLVVQWGYLEPRGGDLLWFLGYNINKDIGAQTLPGMIGPEVYRRNFRSHSIETILDSAGDAIYGIIVTAFEYKSANSADPTIYWQTRIGLPANGKSMSDALPTMLLAAGKAIGKESDSPILRDTDDPREGRVEFGEIKSVGYEEETAPLSKDSPRNK